MSPKLRLGIAVVSTGLIFYIALGSYLGRVFGDTTYGQLSLFNEVIRIVLDSYLEPVNLDRTMNGADLGLGDALDGDSAYLDASELKSYQQAMQESGEVGLSVTRRFSFIIVAAVRPGSPADRAHIRPGDVIKSIDGKHSRNLSVPVADSLLRGAPGSAAKLKILRAHNEVADFSLVRERPTPIAVEKRVLEDGIGYLKIAEFGPTTVDEIETALGSLTRSGAKRLVLDLRGSTNGTPENAVHVASAFLKDGVVTKLVARHTAERTFPVDAGTSKWNGPMVALVDSSTGGPGEVMAAALADAGRSLVGERTIGRVGVQKTIPVADGAFVLTVAKYVSPKGHEIHGKGIEPSVPVQVKEDADEDEDAPDHNAPDAILLKAIEVVKSVEAQPRQAAWRGTRAERLRKLMQHKWIVVTLAAVLVCALAPTGEAATKRRATRAPAARKSRPAPMPAMLLPADPSERDRRVGDACRAGLGRLAGGVVAMDPRTGRVMAVVNPQNTVTQAFTPCSVFKIVVATAGLSEGLITPETTYNCTHGCWMWPGHGLVDLRRALAVSCNTYFEWIGEQLGYPTVQKYAQLLGLGAPTGLNVPTEAPGRVPLFVPPSAVGHLSSHAAGITTSAVQLGVLLSATINGGIVFQPQLAPAQGFVAKERWRLPAKTVYKGLADGFLSAVNEGSATGAFDPNVLVAGKTGSCSHLGWFASYAPADRPEIVLVVFLRGGNGHRASDVAGRIYESLYHTPDGTAPAAVTAAGG